MKTKTEKKKPKFEDDDHIFVGTFPLICGVNVDLFAMVNDRGNGYCYTHPDDTHCPRIKVGIARDDWQDVVGVLIHEAMELCLLVRGLAFTNLASFRTNSDDRTFIMNHSEFSHMTEYMGQFLAKALPEIADVFEKHHKTKKKE